MKIVLLLPALLYVIIILMNTNLLTIKENINLFWIYNIDVYLIAFITFFFVIYILLIWVILKFTNVFSGLRNKKLEKEISILKSKLLDWQDDLIKEIKWEFKEILNNCIERNNKEIDIYKKENEKIISNLEFKIDSFSKKLDKIKK